MITCASATSSVPAGAALISRTITRPAGIVTATVSAAPAFGRSTGVKTLGRSESTAGCDATFTLSSALPAYTGRVTTTPPPSAARSVRSAATATPSFAATRGARSLPVRSEEHTSELQSPCNLVCRLLLEKKKIRQVHTLQRSRDALQHAPQTK